MRRPLVAALVLSAWVAGCGGSDAPLTEYVEALNAMTEKYQAQGEAAWAEYPTTRQPTLGDLQPVLEASAELWAAVEVEFSGLEAPGSIADSHAGFQAWVSRLADDTGALAERSRQAPDWEGFLGSAEFAAYEATLAYGAELCGEFETRLSSSNPELAEMFEGTPWVPRDVAEAVQAALGCETIPEDVETAFGH